MKPTLSTCRIAACFLLLGACTSTPESTPPPPADLQQGPQEEPGVEASDDPAAAAEPADAAATEVKKADVTTLVFSIEIEAPVEHVWDLMFSPEGYTQWTAPFMTGSTFEGSWEEGERIHLLAPGGSGMVAVIAENRRYELVSIKHIGYVMNGVEDTTSDGVRRWAPAYENYRFASVDGGTKVMIQHEVLVGFEGYMNSTWPRALEALKALCEAD